MAQPEGRLSRKIMKAWRQRGVWAWKVHGSEYQPAGIPDICGIYKGWSIWCETKMPGNKPSRIQLHRMNKIMAAGGLTVVAYNVKQAIALLDHIDENHDENCPCLLPRPLEA